MNKNAVLVGRGEFEPIRQSRKLFIFKAFSRYSPFVRQIIFDCVNTQNSFKAIY